MEYVIGIGIAVLVLYKIVIALGRKNAKDVLVANVGLNRKKLDQLSDHQLTELTISLESFAKRGQLTALAALIDQYR